MKKILAGGAVLGALLTSIATVAQADNGDGLLGCNQYEICFSRDADNNTYQRHFYYSDGDHDNDYFTNVNTGVVTSSKLHDNAYKVRNRDGSCDVQVKDNNGLLPAVTDAIPNNGTWTNLKDGVRNQNDEHLRVNC